VLYNINNFVGKNTFTEKLLNLEAIIQSILSIYSAADSKLKQKVLTAIYPKGILLSQDKIYPIENNLLIDLIFKVNKTGMQVKFNSDKRFLCSFVHKQINEVLKIQNN